VGWGVSGATLKARDVNQNAHTHTHPPERACRRAAWNLLPAVLARDSNELTAARFRCPRAEGACSSLTNSTALRSEAQRCTRLVVGSRKGEKRHTKSKR
jgi:hypothetical protein